MPEIFSIFPVGKGKLGELQQDLIDYERGIVQTRGIELYDLRIEENRTALPSLEEMGLIVSPAIERSADIADDRLYFLGAKNPPKVSNNRVYEAYYNPGTRTLYGFDRSAPGNNVMVLLRKFYRFDISSRFYQIAVFKSHHGWKDILLMFPLGTQLTIHFYGTKRPKVEQFKF